MFLRILSLFFYQAEISKILCRRCCVAINEIIRSGADGFFSLVLTIM
ncbi:hypothetical protein B194_0942 [Serratia plymuthica A30]|nr:hypothetical protein B194_0942 [Serratia plymuthica A30]